MKKTLEIALVLPELMLFLNSSDQVFYHHGVLNKEKIKNINMHTLYTSQFYNTPIEVTNIDGEILVIITDSHGRKSIYTWYDIIKKNSQSSYINKCLLGGFIRAIPKNVLIIGFGGGAFGKYLEDHVKNIKITGIDIDETMIHIAKKELHIKSEHFYIMDAKEALSFIKEENITYDLVLIDVYNGEGKIPHYFEDKSFFENIKKISTHDTTVSINFANYEGEKEFYEKIHLNLVSVFGKYYCHLLSGKNNRGNISGIYNLDKFYSAEEINVAYLQKTKKQEILYDANIIKHTILDT